MKISLLSIGRMIFNILQSNWHKIEINRNVFITTLFHSLIISVPIYRKSGSTCTEVAILCHHIFTVALNMDLVRVSSQLV